VVVLDARPEMGLCREALFAPVLAVLPFDTLEDALRMDARCPYALGASIFTRAPERAVRLAAYILPTAQPATPFGGRGASGWGVTQGAEGLLEMTVSQVVSVRGGSFRPHYDSVAGRAPVPTEAVHGLLAWSHGSGLRERLGGLLRLVRGLWRKPRPE
jgi:aldehyde dehydrogenase (NAD+)